MTNIEYTAFGSCSKVENIKIPNSVTTIGGGAFRDVKNIEYNGSATGSPWGALAINGITQ